MNKNERIEIKPIMNGYLVEYSYRVPAKEGKDYSYDYNSDEYAFKAWDEVVAFVQSKPMDTPPAKI